MSRTFGSRARYLGRIAVRGNRKRPDVPLKDVMFGACDTQALSSLLRRRQKSSPDWMAELCEARDIAMSSGATRLQAHLQAEINKIAP